MDRDRRRLLIGAAILAAIALGLWWWMGRKGGEPDVGAGASRGYEDGAAGTPAAGMPVDAGVAEHVGARDGGGVIAGDEAEKARTEPVLRPIPGFVRSPELADPGPGEEFLTRYQGRSGRLSPHALPEDADATTRMRSPGGEPFVIAWVPTIRARRGERVVLHAMVIDAMGAPVRPARIYAQLWLDDPTRLVDVDMLPAPPGATHQFQHEIVLDPATLPAPGPEPIDVHWIVRADGMHDRGPWERGVGGIVQVHDVGGGLDPTTARIVREGGDIVLRVSAQLETAGRYWSYAELWGGPDGDQPIAFGRKLIEDGRPGRIEIEILFGGAVIRASGIDGPYVVRNLRFMQVDRTPPQEQEPVPIVGETPPWPASSFQ